jgi:probable F420-dependent oxidoreductase
MQLGIMLFPADHALAPDTAARAAEERGFGAIAFPEHTHIPVSRRTPFPGGTPLPNYYARTHDPFIALTAAAMVTDRIELWTGISLVAQRDPIVTAKVVASLDVLSKGRFVFGIGYGWNVEELQDHGVAYADRRAVVRERMLAMQELWSKDEASFQGEHVRFDPTWSWPKPVQDPWPKIVLGSSPGPKSFAHVAEFCDGWVPISGLKNLAEHLPQLHAALAERGCDPSAIEISLYGGRPDAGWLEHAREAGVHRVFLPIPPDDPDAGMRALDAYAPLAARA